MARWLGEPDFVVQGLWHQGRCAKGIDFRRMASRCIQLQATDVPYRECLLRRSWLMCALRFLDADSSELNTFVRS